MATACTGRTPTAISSGTTTATGAPNPAMPCRKEENTQASASTTNSSLRLNREIPCRSASYAPACLVTW